MTGSFDMGFGWSSDDLISGMAHPRLASARVGVLCCFWGGGSEFVLEATEGGANLGAGVCVGRILPLRLSHEYLWQGWASALLLRFVGVPGAGEIDEEFCAADAALNGSLDQRSGDPAGLRCYRDVDGIAQVDSGDAGFCRSALCRCFSATRLASGFSARVAFDLGQRLFLRSRFVGRLQVIGRLLFVSQYSLF